MRLRAAAKINLFLQIVGERSDGYHDLSMILQSINLCDFVSLEPLPQAGIELVCDYPEIPPDATNLAHRAAQLLLDQFPDGGGVKITLEKHIPAGAGLAGGSADAAAVLVGLNHLWELALTPAELRTYAAKLGSDIPFCLDGGTSLATGRGEVLTPLSPLAGIPIVVCKDRQLSVSTAWAYQTFRTERHIERPTASAIAPMLTLLSHNPKPHQIAPNLFNDLERAVLPHYPAIAHLKTALAHAGALGVLMSGSGSAVFGVFDAPDRAQSAAQAIADRFPAVDTWATTTIGWGNCLTEP